MEIGLGIVNLILWVITWCVIAEQQEIQDKYNELLANEIYKIKKNRVSRNLKIK